jgi:hypothetical protein
MQYPNAPLIHTAKLALAVGLTAGLALILIAAARPGRPSGISESLESEDRAFDDSIAPGAPL